MPAYLSRPRSIQTYQDSFQSLVGYAGEYRLFCYCDGAGQRTNIQMGSAYPGNAVLNHIAKQSDN